jgi:hypothetical protein
MDEELELLQAIRLSEISFKLEARKKEEENENKKKGNSGNRVVRIFVQLSESLVSKMIKQCMSCRYSNIDCKHISSHEMQNIWKLKSVSRDVREAVWRVLSKTKWELFCLSPKSFITHVWPLGRKDHEHETSRVVHEHLSGAIITPVFKVVCLCHSLQWTKTARVLSKRFENIELHIV